MVPARDRPLPEALRANLLFVSGKGGVGKTLVSRALAAAYAKHGAKKTLWVTFEDPTQPLGQLRELEPGLWHLNAEAIQAFDEYIGIKIGVPALAHLFLKNKVIRYLAKAAPGLHELVLLGKVWFERRNYDHVVVDMPSTGYGVAMFQSTANFARLFGGGPLHKDAEGMLETFGDPSLSAQLIVGLPEEMPLRESLELNEFLLRLFPRNPAAFLVNKRFPGARSAGENAPETPDEKAASPLARSASDYVQRRARLEASNLRIWDAAGLRYESLPYFRDEAFEQAERWLSRWLDSAAAQRASAKGQPSGIPIGGRF